MCESDTEVRYRLFALGMVALANPEERILTALEQHFIDSMVAPEVPLSRRERQIAADILCRHKVHLENLEKNPLDLESELLV